MVRPVGGAASRGKRVVAPSPDALMQAVGSSGAFGSRQMQGITKIVGQEFKGLPTAQSYGEFDEIIALFGNKRRTNAQAKETMKYYDPMTGSQYENYGEEPDMVDDSPAELTLVPTSTINPERPRTVAAGYDKNEQKITVVFRDGTFYNYYEVTQNEWIRFKAVVSKGRYIMAYLDSKPRGQADVSSISQTARTAFYRFSRAAQRHYTSNPNLYTSTYKPRKK